MAIKKDEVKPDLIAEKHDLATTIKLGLPTHEEALDVYRRLGAKRSYPLVVKYFDNQKRPSPAATTLKTWGAKYGWRLKAHEWDVDVARQADEEIKRGQALDAAKDLKDVAGKMRQVSYNLLEKLRQKVTSLTIATGGEAKAVAEAAVALNKAAEVLDGGVSDRTETRTTMTVEERKTAAQKMVDDAFRKFTTGGQDNGRRDTTGQQQVDNAAVDGRSAASV